MDMTFYEYLNEKRITKAEELLYTTVLSITDIAMNWDFHPLVHLTELLNLSKGVRLVNTEMNFYICPKDTGESQGANEIRIRARSGGRPLWYFCVKTSQQMQGRRQDLRSENKREKG